MIIFRNQNRTLDSVSDAESNGVKLLARFPGNTTLEILIKIHNCVGSTNMRGRFLMKVCRVITPEFRVKVRI